MRIQEGQCVLGILFCQILLSVCQVRFGEGTTMTPMAISVVIESLEFKP